MKRNLSFEATYPHAPEKVWRALTEREAISQWLMENDFEARVGHRFQFRAKPQPGWSGIVSGEVLVVEPPRRLVYSWKTESIDTIVAFTLEPVPTGTRLTLVHDGFDGFKAVMISYILGSGWKGIVNTHIPNVIAKLGE